MNERTAETHSDIQPAAQFADALAADGQHGVRTAHAQGEAVARPREDAHDVAQVDKAGLVDAIKVLLAEPALVFAERGRIGIALAGDGVEDAAAADAVKRPV